MKYIHATPETMKLPLGYQGEGDRTVVIFDITEIQEELSGAEYNVFVQRPYETTSHTVQIGVVEDPFTHEQLPFLTWRVARYDTLVHGKGKCRVVAVKNDTVIMSREWTTEIEKSMPEPESFTEALADDD